MAWNGYANRRNYSPGWAEGSVLQNAFDGAANERNYDPGDWAGGSVLQGGFGAAADQLADDGLVEQLGWWCAPDLDPPYLANQDPFPLTTGVDKSKIAAFDLLDSGVGVELSTVRIYVETVLAYRGDTDAFQSPYDGAGSARSVVADGYHFAINKTVYWPSLGTVSVRVVADDTNSNSLDTTYSFDVEDHIDPTVDTNTPTGIGVAAASNILYSTKDEIGGSGIDQATIDTTVGGVPAITSGVFQAGFSGTIIANAFNGYDVVINPDADLPSFGIIQVVVDVDDLDGNSGGLTWSFQILDYLGCLVTPIAPTVGQIDVLVGSLLVIQIEDEDQVLSGTILIAVDYGLGYETAFEYAGIPQFKAGWDGPGSNVAEAAGVYTVTIDKITDFPLGSTIQVRVTADDPTGNPERLP